MKKFLIVCAVLSMAAFAFVSCSKSNKAKKAADDYAAALDELSSALDDLENLDVEDLDLEDYYVDEDDIDLDDALELYGSAIDALGSLSDSTSSVKSATKAYSDTLNAVTDLAKSTGVELDKDTKKALDAANSMMGALGAFGF